MSTYVDCWNQEDIYIYSQTIDQPILGCLSDVNFSIVLVEILRHQQLKYVFYIHNRC